MLRLQKQKNKRVGFTLVEALISSALFFVIAGSFVAAYISAMRTHRMASNFYRATCIARNRIQRARTLDYDSLALLSEVEASVDENGNRDLSGHFQRTTSISNTVLACTRIRVNVKFPISGGGVSPEGVEVHTMIAEGM